MIKTINGQDVFIKKVTRDGRLNAMQEASIALIYSKTDYKKAIVEVYDRNGFVIGKYGCYGFERNHGRLYYKIVEMFYNQQMDEYDRQVFEELLKGKKDE